MEDGVDLDEIMGDTFLDDDEGALGDLEDDESEEEEEEGEEEDLTAPMRSRAEQHRPEDEEGESLPGHARG